MIRRVDVADLRPSEVRAVSDALCVVRTDDGTVHAFARTCPHAGADLAIGYERHGRIHCAWHNLGFYLRTGEAACMSVPALMVLAVREIAEGVVEVLEPVPDEDTELECPSG